MRPARVLRTLRSWRTIGAALLTAVSACLVVTATGGASYAANPVTPGNYTGKGFDQCEAPSQYAMDRWRAYSPYRAAGIYISGNSRACRRQTNLTPTWVSRQLAAGWHLMPITMGPQASCSTRFPRYGASIDPTINPSSTNTYATARAQARSEADRAASAAAALGIVAGSTLFYDLEAFDIRRSTACTTSALWFLTAWTRQLHRDGYASGYYSSAASGIKIVDDARVRSDNPYRLPDQIWIADWDGRATTSSAYVRSDGWQPYARAKQYRGGHNETWGGVTINIDNDYLSLRTPVLGSGNEPVPSTSMSDPKCTSSSISRLAYRYTDVDTRTDLIVPLQCVLKQQRYYPYMVTGTWNTRTTSAIETFQAKAGHRVAAAASRSDWTALLSRGNSGSVLRLGSTGADVVRVQRALNAALDYELKVTGTYNLATESAVRAYQTRVGITSTGVVASQTWAALVAGRRR